MFPSSFTCTLATKALALAMVVSTLALIPITRVSANGPHVGSVQVFNGSAGPYKLRVEAVPLVGNLHLTIFVSQLQSDGPVTEASIQVVGRGPGSDPRQVGPVSGANDFRTAPNAYAATLLPDQAGPWVFTVTIHSAEGEATVDVPVVVQQPGEANWLAPTLVVLLFVLLWQMTARLWERRHKSPAPL